MAKKKQSEYDLLMKTYRKLAKQADQRLVRLEQYAKEPQFKNILKFAYNKAMRDIKYWGGEKATRFNIKPPSRLDQLRSKIRDIEKFLSWKSSTKAGIKQVYKKRAETYNKKYGLKLKPEDMAAFFDSSEFQRAMEEKDGYTSKTYMRAVGEIQAHEKEILKKMKKGQDVNLRIDDDLVNDTVNQLLNKYGKDVVNLY